MLTDKGYIPGRIYRRDSSATPLRERILEFDTRPISRRRDNGPSLIPHCFDHVWNLKRLSIITLPSREKEERERKREREREERTTFFHLCVRVIIEWTARHLPVKSTRGRPWKIMPRRRSPRMSALLLLPCGVEWRAYLREAVATRAFHSYHYAIFNGSTNYAGVRRVCVRFEFAARDGEKEKERKIVESGGSFNGTSFQKSPRRYTGSKDDAVDSAGIERA